MYIRCEMKNNSLTKTISPIALAAMMALNVNADVPASATLSNHANSGYIIYTDAHIGVPHELSSTFDQTQLINALAGD